ncbi:MAG: class C sortase, partial [Micrococcales bacterium]|nr:class C sortase [Micrococcales bacterium]
GNPEALDGGQQVYNTLLNVDGTGLMGVLRIPRIRLSLPIYHGTSQQELDRGVGHLYGSSLPVGGAGTHAVLTGHSGVPQSTLFTGVHDLKLGDIMQVQILDEVLTYQVDQIKVVDPDNTTDLQRTPGKDYLTLVTCTPIGVNSQRLLVRGIRIPTPESATSQALAVQSTPMPGFPWWTLGMTAGPAASTLVTHRRGGWRRAKGQATDSMRRMSMSLQDESGAFLGLPALFRQLSVLDAGDEFTIPVFDRPVTYRVDQIVTVDPREPDSTDRVTVMTCAPVDDDSYRLIVRGLDRAPKGGVALDASFPWWTLIFAGVQPDIEGHDELPEGAANVVPLHQPKGLRRRLQIDAATAVADEPSDASPAGGTAPAPDRVAVAERIAEAERVAEAQRVTQAERAAQAQAAAEAQMEADRVAQAQHAAQAEAEAQAQAAAQADRVAQAQRAADVQRVAQAQWLVDAQGLPSVATPPPTGQASTAQVAAAHRAAVAAAQARAAQAAADEAAIIAEAARSAATARAAAAQAAAAELAQVRTAATGVPLPAVATGAVDQPFSHARELLDKVASDGWRAELESMYQPLGGDADPAGNHGRHQA